MKRNSQVNWSVFLIGFMWMKMSFCIFWTSSDLFVKAGSLLTSVISTKKLWAVRFDKSRFRQRRQQHENGWIEKELQEETVSGYYVTFWYTIARNGPPQLRILGTLNTRRKDFNSVNAIHALSFFWDAQQKKLYISYSRQSENMNGGSLIFYKTSGWDLSKILTTCYSATRVTVAT